MLAWIWALLTNAEEFKRATSGVDLAARYEKLKTPIKALAIALGGAILSGQIDLGPKAWWLAPVIMGAQGFIQKTPDVAKSLLSLSNGDLAKLKAHLAAEK